MKRIIASAAIILAMTACQNNRTNPFLTEWDTPYGIPPFEQILPSDFIPAIKAGIEQQNAEIDAIVANPDTPTFENTIAPLELSGSILAIINCMKKGIPLIIHSRMITVQHHFRRSIYKSHRCLLQ